VPFTTPNKTNILWTIASFKPKSRRFSQLSFEGFKPRGNNMFERGFNAGVEFVKFIGKYAGRKSRKTLLLGQQGVMLAVNTGVMTKGLLVRKLIWSRGKLGRPVATSIVMSAAFLVFMFGKVLNSSRFVNSQEIDPDYLANVSDIIPQKNTALTTIPDSRKRAEPFTHTIREGDTLSSLGNEYKISVDAIKYVNNLNDASVLSLGDEIVIPPVSGLIHKVARGDTLSGIASKYEVAPQAIADFNYILNTSSLAVGSELVIPDAKVPQPVAIPTFATPSVVRPASAPAAVVASSDWCMWPTTTRIITQYFTWYHNGLDIAASHGGAMPPLYACSGGTVTRSGWDPTGLGLQVRIDHGNGYETIYGHMSRIDVGYGESVSKGQVIGIMGSTGRSTGPHVHFIINYNGVAQDPLGYIQ
jgi:murein DD-endopeptidase MepM/ murein hydrolase activator NlpD